MRTDSPYSVLVVDDEPLARHRLERLLEKDDDVVLAGSVSNGLDAVTKIEELDPDIVLLDVQMPGLSGVDVVRRIDRTEMPVVIFVTAYEEHALDAFELTALDYLLKPYDDDRFRDALGRAKRMVDMRKLEGMRHRIEAAAHADVAEVHYDTPRYLERIAVEMRGRIKVVPVDEVDYISASGPYAELTVDESTYLIREQMQELDDQLDPDEFFRIHRSTIVRLDRIDSLFVSSGSRYAVRLKNGTRLRVSRSRWDELSVRLGIQPLRKSAKEA